MTGPGELEIGRPDDWHLHVRDGAMLRATLPFTSRVFARAIIMPNLKPPVRTTREAAAYRERIRAALPDGHDFTPLMTAYLTDDTSPDDLEEGHRRGLLTAVKLYPAGATTNSESGVTDIAKTYGVLERMERIGLPLLVHGEVADREVDVFDREAVFIERVLDPLRRRFPGLRLVLEHVTTAEAVDYVRAASGNLAATITPHHLMINRNALFDGGLRPHMYCLPVAKRERHRRALRRAAASGDRRFFFGSDSAPHPAHDKEAECGCAGIFNAPTALECVATVFEEEGALDRLEAFVSLNGARFYGLPPNAGRVKLARATGPADVPDRVRVSETAEVRVFMGGGPLRWTVDWEPGGSAAAAHPDRDHCQPSGG